MDPRVAQVVLDESDSVVGGIPGFLLSMKNELSSRTQGTMPPMHHPDVWSWYQKILIKALRHCEGK